MHFSQHTRDLIALLIIAICLVMTAHSLTKNRCKICRKKLELLKATTHNISIVKHRNICCNCAGCYN